MSYSSQSSAFEVPSRSPSPSESGESTAELALRHTGDFVDSDDWDCHNAKHPIATDPLPPYPGVENVVTLADQELRLRRLPQVDLSTLFPDAEPGPEYVDFELLDDNGIVSGHGFPMSELLAHTTRHLAVRMSDPFGDVLLPRESIRLFLSWPAYRHFTYMRKITLKDLFSTMRLDRIGLAQEIAALYSEFVENCVSETVTPGQRHLSFSSVTSEWLWLYSLRHITDDIFYAEICYPDVWGDGKMGSL
ncbi:hypothetical protein A0H81_05004 [Grifola frondosa]|uniref:Uncharacterized protein n=1 Tax=Grifola frondosa TaxID=5627 RepID=A0A1C7MET2_GRIFR|nr:hypothetical protein A0H81_05004 [Grifola frondosa]